MELYVKYARTIDNRMTVYKITSNQSDEGLGFVCSYKSHDDDFFSNSYVIVNGDLAGLYHYSEDETLQECLQHLVKMIACFDGCLELQYECGTTKSDAKMNAYFEDHTELHFEGKTIKSKAQETYDIDEFNSLFE